MINLKEQVVLVTGGSAGLGKAIALKAAEKGATVVVAARRGNLLEKTAMECSALAKKPCYSFQVDMADKKDIDFLVARLQQKNLKVDILVNAAGFGWFDPYFDFDFSLVEKMFQVNVLGLMYLTRLLGKEMAERNRGHIINIASQAGKMATPKSSVYSATKFAVIGFSNALRLELKPFNVAVTTVNPGPIATDFFKKADPSGNYLAKVNWLVLDPEKLAAKIVASFGTFKREINDPWFMESASRFYGLFPKVGDYLAGNVFNKK